MLICQARNYKVKEKLGVHINKEAGCASVNKIKRNKSLASGDVIIAHGNNENWQYVIM
jgi:hypothetical protein